MRLSYEFFPPRSTTQQRRFWRTLGCLETLNPEFISMTWGALGSDQASSLERLAELSNIGIPVAAHLTCIGQTVDTMRDTFLTLRKQNIRHIVALRGDLPDGKTADAGTMKNAIELVRLISAEAAINHKPTEISVAAYPETHPDAISARDDLTQLHNKLEAGAKRAITQFFFNADRFLSWRDEAKAIGIRQAIVPGILPVHDINKVIAFSKKCGATVPKELVKSFSRYTDTQSHHAVALEHAYTLCQTLHREGVDDFHFYTLNQSDLAWQLGCLLRGKEKLQDLVLDTAA